jgi:hypothetical protein
MLVEKVQLPQNSLFRGIPVKYNYSDSYSIEVDYNIEHTPEFFAKNFLTNFSSWVYSLFKLRNILVKPFGIPADDGIMDYPFQTIQKGAVFSFFNVLDFKPEELLLFAPDKHLDAWFSFYVLKKGNRNELTITTIVKYNNIKGRFYFTFIRPFHKLIIISKMKSMLKKPPVLIKGL